MGLYFMSLVTKTCLLFWSMLMMHASAFISNSIWRDGVVWGCPFFVQIFFLLYLDFAEEMNLILFRYFICVGLQISGEPSLVRKALYQIASRLHDNPSRSQHLLASAVPTGYSSGGSLMGPTSGAPIMGLAPLVGTYGGYRGDSGDWSRSLYSAPRDEASSKEFSLRLVCPIGNIGGVIGKGGVIINQIRQESGAAIKVDSTSAAEADDCLIAISAKEVSNKSCLHVYVLWAHRTADLVMIFYNISTNGISVL